MRAIRYWLFAIGVTAKSQFVEWRATNDELLIATTNLE
jgi:hypothetical protein